MTNDSPKTRSFPGRPHDVVSYSGALMVMLSVSLWRNPVSVWHLPALLGTSAWCLHFLRRIVECLFVHRYAERKVPTLDAFSEYLYYWGFGAWNAWALSSAGARSVNAISLLGLGLFLVGEIGNAWAHLKLRALRRPNTLDRGLPKGGLFSWVSCPNYTYEILAWVGFAAFTQTLAALVFLVAVTVVLFGWANKRHARYHKLFDGKDGRQLYPPERRALIPFLIAL